MNKKNRAANEIEINFEDDIKVKRNKKKRRKFKALPKWEKALLIIISILAVVALALGGVLIYVTNGIRGEDLNHGNLDVSPEIVEKYGDNEIVNVALFGVDTRNANSFKGNSDTIMIISVDKKKNTVKLTSILRDSYVAMDGKKNQKITHAYGYGGAEYAVKTINKNFNMNITDYVTVNFFKFSEAIDILGGVDMEINETERKKINEIANSEGRKVPLIKNSGFVHLTGEQAVTFARLRHDSDVVRSERQKKLIDALMVQVKKVSPTKYPELLNKMISLCETSLTTTEILSFTPMLTSGFSIKTSVVPSEDDNPIGGVYEGHWVWRYDLKAASERLHKFIYEDIEEGTTADVAAKKAG